MLDRLIYHLSIIKITSGDWYLQKNLKLQFIRQRKNQRNLYRYRIRNIAHEPIGNGYGYSTGKQNS